MDRWPYAPLQRLEEIYFPEDPLPLYINKKSESLRVIQQLRDEGTVCHYLPPPAAKQESIRSGLDGIPGIGPASQKLLSRHSSR